jgi:hypothetical protein
MIYGRGGYGVVAGWCGEHAGAENGTGDMEWCRAISEMRAPRSMAFAHRAHVKATRFSFTQHAPVDGCLEGAQALLGSE